MTRNDFEAMMRAHNPLYNLEWEAEPSEGPTTRINITWPGVFGMWLKVATEATEETLTAMNDRVYAALWTLYQHNLANEITVNAMAAIVVKAEKEGLL